MTAKISTDEKIALLRKAMRDAGVQAYIVPTSDPHMTEYNAKHFEARHWLTGFTGSAGTALVTVNAAKLWADGRYFIQAEHQIAGTEFELMKLATPGYPTLLEFLSENLKEGDVVGVNGAIMNQAQVERYEEVLGKKGIKIELNLQLVADIWTDQPEMPKGEIFTLGTEWTGRSTETKIADLRKYLEKKESDVALIGRLDDVAWLYNFRGSDIECTPVAYAFAMVSQDKAELFIDLDKVNSEVRATMEAEGVNFREYDDIYEAVAELSGKTLRLDKTAINSLVYSKLPEDVEVINGRDWTLDEKAVKNETEIKNQYEAYRKDGIAFTKLIHWLKTQEDVSKFDELDVDAKALEFREELDTFVELSFGTIAAYGPNAAMAHYAATEENKAQLQNKSFMLVDAGGQYWEGTTDTTRTIAVGELTAEEIKDYTLTVMSHVDLAMAVFLEGSTGYQLDMLARKPMWENHMDFKHGTGHGIGYFLNVHEGPQSISSGRYNTTVMEEGMITSNEPGVYKEDKHGIRIESVVVCEEAATVGTDKFLKFDTMTRVPLEREAIDKSMLNEEQIAWINEYHEKVYKDINQDLTPEEAEWLKEVCKPL